MARGPARHPPPDASAPAGGAARGARGPGAAAAQFAWLADTRGLLAVAAGEDEEAPQVWLVPLPQGAPRRLTSDLLEYRVLSLTADGASLVTVAADATASVWLSPRDRKGRPRRLTSARIDGLFGLDFGPDGRVVYTSGGG